MEVYNQNHATLRGDTFVTYPDGSSFEFKDTVTYSKTAGTFHVVGQLFLNGHPVQVDSVISHSTV